MSGLEGGLQGSQRFLEPSFEARFRGHLRMRGMGGRSVEKDQAVLPASMVSTVPVMLRALSDIR
ncbi:hypothetical protein HNR00_002580 [Methylorubrum rhodinum]|uniref:Uncharacterized protein n=1 Tax=Methylorubrum rhodinum TaxID=29428 RepID=A0A840ZL22_9HYPH|nr:hypothetical protein [Methylorubrum rhodinum]